MSGDVNYQSLKRITYLPDRLQAYDGGTVIAGQEYNDVYFAGGTLENVTINGITTSLSVREVTTPGDIDVLSTDNVIAVGNNSGGATNVNLLAASDGKAIFIKDLGNASTHNITVVPDGSDTIDGQSSYVIGQDWGWLEIAPVTGGWIILG